MNIDPMSKAFWSNETLEIEERTGLALIEAAKHAKISFNKFILPMVDCTTENGSARFNFSGGITYDYGNADNVANKFPEQKDEIQYYSDKFRQYDKKRSTLYSPAYFRLAGASAIWAGGWGGHSNPDFGRIVNIGTNGIRKLIDKYKEINTHDCDWFYRSCEYALDALDILGERFCRLAKEKAAICVDENDKKRYEAAARAFETVPKEPAYDFTSACHAFWMLFSFDGIDSPGRFDQYMYRSYLLTQDEAEISDVLERVWGTFNVTRTWNLCLSGSNEDWEDQSNDLTYRILALAREKKYHTPNITLRVHRNTPKKLWDEIAQTLATGIGMPALYNDEVVCPALEKVGIPPCDSHCYCMNGCNQIDIMGKSHMGLEDGEVIFAKCLEYALNDGKNMITGEQDSVPTGDPSTFKTYSELENAFYSQLEYATYMVCESSNAAQHSRAVYSPNPLRSCLIEGCIEKGRDYRNGGPLYGHGQVLAEAIADAGDSLYAVKKLVFDDKKYTMKDLCDALNADFCGYEKLHHDFSSCEKFGNDKDEVDNITVKALNRFFTFLKRNHTYRGGVFMGGCSPYNRAANYGKNIAALPNGKHKCDPLIADCIGATPGRDKNGPTALMKSALKYNHIDGGSGFIFHAKFEKSLLETQKGKDTLIALAKTYFAGGGQQYTVSAVNREELLDAQINPQKHGDIIVRVGGYSDIFVNLSKELQDNVIARTFVEI